MCRTLPATTTQATGRPGHRLEEPRAIHLRNEKERRGLPAASYNSRPAEAAPKTLGRAAVEPITSHAATAGSGERAPTQRLLHRPATGGPSLADPHTRRSEAPPDHLETQARRGEPKDHPDGLDERLLSSARKQETFSFALNILGKGQFGARPEADGRACVLRCREAAGASVKVPGG